MSRNYLFDCDQCLTRCDGVSKGRYAFSHDVNLSELIEIKIIKSLNERKINASKSESEGYPDIEVVNEQGLALLFIEIKVQRRTFMAVNKLLPSSDLIPSETVALNLSDLIRYFEIQKATGVDVYLLWAVQDRPCILGEKKIDFFYQDLKVLYKIYCKYKNFRRFRRKSGLGDVIDGVHKGVVVNYHFSLLELLPFNIEDFVKWIRTTYESHLDD